MSGLQSRLIRSMRRGTAAFVLTLALAAAGWGPSRAVAEDWPTHGHDTARTNVSNEQLELPLSTVWTYRSPYRPEPLWASGPAKQNFWWNLSDLTPKVTYDRAYHVAVVGDRVYFGASGDNKVLCLDAASGKEVWHFFTEGPVRLAPAVSDGRVYFGSDDGWAYCLSAADGALVWKHKAAPEDYRLIGNGRMISLWPIRTGILVRDGSAYFAAGMFGKEDVFLCAVDAATGERKWLHSIDAHPDGYLLASSSQLYMPTGRTTPLRFSLENGKTLGTFGGEGGAFALVPEDMLITGPGHVGKLTAYDPKTQKEIASFNGLRMIVASKFSYLQTKNAISALDRGMLLETKRKQEELKQRQERLTKRIQSLKSVDDKLTMVRAKVDDLIAQAERAQEKARRDRKEADKDAEKDKKDKDQSAGARAKDQAERAQDFKAWLREAERWKAKIMAARKKVSLAETDVKQSQAIIELKEKEMAELTLELGKIPELMAACISWNQPSRTPFSMILAGETLFAGGKDDVVALDAATGETLWSGAVDGKAYGLAVANGRLYVSTDRGFIHAFAPGRAEDSPPIEQKQAFQPLDAVSFTMGTSGEGDASFITHGPYVRFTGGGSVRVYWKTRNPTPSVIEYGLSDQLSWRAENPKPTRDHALKLSDLEPGLAYAYRIQGGASSSPIYAFDSTFDDSPGPAPDLPSPFPEDDLSPVYARAAEQIIEATGIRRGYCLVMGSGEGRLAYELARRTRLKIIGVDDDAERIARARGALDRAGLYGRHISIFQSDLKQTPFASYFANLIVSDRLLAEGEMGGSVREMLRLLRPSGGAVYLGLPKGTPAGANSRFSPDRLRNWLAEGGVDPNRIEVAEAGGAVWVKTVRGVLEGAGEWSHFYSNPENTANSEDQLVQGPLRVLWFGRPGPRLMIDRHLRPMSSLYKDGRTFVPGLDRIIAIDSYNGARLWDLSVPNSRRMGAFKDAAQMAVASDFIYIAADDRVCGVDVQSGEPELFISAPQHVEGRTEDWGYLAILDQTLIGTGQPARASRRSYRRETVDDLYADGRGIVASDYLFSLDRHTGQEFWHYQQGKIINPTITIGDGRIYFIESRNPSVLNDSVGRPRLPEAIAPGYGWIVALELKTGRKAWERQVDLGYENVAFLSYAENKLLANGTRNESNRVYYVLNVFDGKTGEPLWENKFDGGAAGGSHGEQDQHPVINGDTIFMRPYDYNLTSGQKGQMTVDRAGHGCGALSGSADYLFGRGGNPQMYDIGKGGQATRVTDHTRPGCWLNMIPAGGILQIPESSSGCSCAFSFQASMAFIAKDRAGGLGGS